MDFAPVPRNVVGTSPYAQIRVACRPEATLLTLTSRD